MIEKKVTRPKESIKLDSPEAILKNYGAFDENTEIIQKEKGTKFFVINKEDKSKKREYDSIKLAKAHEEKLKFHETKFNKQMQELIYLYERNTGKKFNKTPTLPNHPDEQGFVRIKGQKVTISEYISNLAQEKPSRKVALQNLIKTSDSKILGFERFINHEDRIGRTISQFMSERKINIQANHELMEQYDKQAKDSGSKLLSVKAGYLALTEPIKKVTSYVGAIVKAASSTIIHDLLPFRWVAENTLGKAWTATTKSGLSGRELAGRIEEKISVDYITKKGVRSGAITQEKVREASLKGAAWAIRMTLIPELLSSISSQFAGIEFTPKAFYDLFRSGKMFLPNLGSIEKLVPLEHLDSKDKIKSTSTRTKVQTLYKYFTPEYIQEVVNIVNHSSSGKDKALLGLTAALVGIAVPIAEKAIPPTGKINWVLMTDLLVMNYLGVTQKYTREKGLELTKAGNILHAAEAGFTASFALDAGMQIFQKLENYRETGKLNPLENFKNESELLEFIRTHKNVFTSENTGIFGRYSSFEERFISQLRGELDTNDQEISKHIIINDGDGIHYYTVTSTSESDLQIIKQDSNGTYLLENNHFEKLPQVSTHDGEQTRQENTIIETNVVEHRDKTRMRIQENFYNKDGETDNTNSNLSKLENTLEVLLSKISPDDSASMAISDSNSKNNETILINGESKYLDQSVAELYIAIKSMELMPGENKALIEKILIDHDMGAYSQLHQRLVDQSDNYHLTLNDTVLDPNDPEYSITSISDNLNVVKLLYGDFLEKTDREYILSLLTKENLDSSISTYPNSKILSVSNFSVIETERDRKIFVIFGPDENSHIAPGYKSDLLFQTFETLNPEKVAQADQKTQMPQYNIVQPISMQADIRAKVLSSHPEFKEIISSTFYSNGTSQIIVSTDDNTQVVYSDPSGTVLSSLVLGENDTKNVEIADFQPYIKSTLLPDQKDLEFNGESTVTVSVATPQDFTGDKLDFIGQAIRIQAMALTGYDYLIFTDAQGHATVANVRPSSLDSTAIRSNIKIGIVSDKDGVINSGVAELGLNELISQLSNSGSLNIVEVTPTDKWVAQAASRANNLLDTNHVQYEETIGSLTMLPTESHESYTDKDRINIKNAYQRAYEFAASYQKSFDYTVDLLDYDQFESILLEQGTVQKEYSEKDLIKLFGLENTKKDGVEYQHITYIPEGVTIKKEGLSTRFNISTDDIEYRQSSLDPTLWFVGTKLSPEQAVSTFDHPAHLMAYQIQEQTDSGFNFRYVSDLKGDELVTAYVPLEKPIVDQKLEYWKTAALDTHYLGEKVFTISKEIELQNYQLYIDPLSLNVYTIEYKDGEEVILPVTDVKITYEDLYKLTHGYQKDENISIQKEDIRSIIENQLGMQIVNWSKESKNIFQNDGGTIKSLEKYDIEGSFDSWQLAKHGSKNELLVTQTGQLVYQNEDTGKFFTYNKDSGVFENASAGNFVDLTTYLEGFNALVSKDNIPLQWKGVPLFCKDDIVYIMSAGGIIPIGNKFIGNQYNFTPDPHLTQYLDSLGINGSDMIESERSYSILTSNFDKYIHSAASSLSQDFIETKSGIVDINSGEKYLPYLNGSIVDSQNGKVIFENNSGNLFYLEGSIFQEINLDQTESISQWIKDNGFSNSYFQDRQTRLNVYTDSQNFAYILTARGIEPLGRFDALQKTGLIGNIELEGTDFNTNLPETFGEIIKDNRFTLEEKIGQILDPVFAELVNRVISFYVLDKEQETYNFSKIHNESTRKMIEYFIEKWRIDYDRSRLDTTYLRQITPESKYLTYDQIPPRYIQAVLSSEGEVLFNKDTGQEIGVDTRGIFRAILSNIFGNGVSGGSTLPMQLAKNASWSFEERAALKWTRKVSEWVMANVVVDNYSPEKIFESYVNIINYGKGEGIVTGAQEMFHKEVSDLDLAETALLAVLPKNPNGQGLWSQAAASNWADNASAVIRRMEENGFISNVEKEEAYIEIYRDTHIDTKDTDIEFIAKELQLNSDELKKVAELAKEYDNLDFADRFEDIYETVPSPVNQGIPPGGIALQPPTTQEFVKTEYHDFLWYLDHSNLFDNIDQETFKEKYYDLINNHRPLIPVTSPPESIVKENINPGPQFMTDYENKDGERVQQLYWEKVSGEDIAIRQDLPITSSARARATGELEVFEALAYYGDGSYFFEPIYDERGRPLSRGSDGNMYVYTAQGMIKLTQKAAFMEHSDITTDLAFDVFPANLRPGYTIFDKDIEADLSNVMTGVDRRGFVTMLPDGRTQSLGYGIELPDGRLYVKQFDQEHDFALFERAGGIETNNIVQLVTKQATRYSEYYENIDSLLESMPTSDDNPWEGIVGKADDKSGLGVNPNVVVEALNSNSVPSKAFILHNTPDSVEIFKELVETSKSTHKSLMVWVNQSLESEFRTVKENGIPINIEVSTSEKPVIVFDIETIDGKEYVFYSDYESGKILSAEIEVFKKYMSPREISPLKMILVGDKARDIKIPENLKYDYDSKEVQVAIQLSREPYIYGSNPDIDRKMSINYDLQRLALESAKDIVLNSRSDGFQMIMMDSKGNIISAAGLDKDGNILPIQDVLSKQFVPGSVMKPISGYIAVANGTSPYTAQTSGTPYQPEELLTLSEALIVSNNQFFTNRVKNMPSGIFEKWLNKFGFGVDIINPTLPSDPGFVGDDKWAMETFGRNLTDTERSRKSIGYGDMQVTLLELIRSYYAIGENGSSIVPSITTNSKPSLSDPIFTNPRGLDQILEGLKDATTEKNGTSYKSFGKIGIYNVWAKTGTAITDGEPNSVFSGFFEDPDTKEKTYFTVLFPKIGNGSEVAAPFMSKIIQACIADPDMCSPNDGRSIRPPIELEEIFTPPGWDITESSQKDLIQFSSLIRENINEYQLQLLKDGESADPDTFIHLLETTIQNSPYSSQFVNNKEYEYVLNRIKETIAAESLGLSKQGIQRQLYVMLLASSHLPGAPTIPAVKGGAQDTYNALAWNVYNEGKNKFEGDVFESTKNKGFEPGDTVWSKDKETGYVTLVLDKYEHDGVMYYKITDSNTNVWAHDNKLDGIIRDRWVTYDEMLFQFKVINDGLLVLRPFKQTK